LDHEPSGSTELPAAVSPTAPDFVQSVLAKAIAGRGDTLPVSAMPIDGTFPTGTSKWEKRNIAQQIPVWDPNLCIQCGKCVLVCPHSVIRAKVYDAEHLARAPSSFKAANAKWREFDSMRYTLQVSPQDCTSCNLCFEICPVKSKTETKRRAINMEPQASICDGESTNWEFFLSLPQFERSRLSPDTVKNVQVLEPLFEFSGACAGCGETPYIKLLTQLFGDRLVIANATGCSSIYGGNLPTTPYATNAHGRGPAWSNSLFEDNAEFGLGMRLAIDKQNEFARELVARLAADLGDSTVAGLLQADQSTDTGVDEQRRRVAELKGRLMTMGSSDAAALLAVADTLVRRSVWLVGGDGWAYDIGAGGLDHVLELGRNINVLVLDTEVYSNTGGQSSKATPRGAVAKFCAGGKPAAKKDLAMEAVNYGSVYVARVAMGGNDMHTVTAFLEAESYDGPSIIIAYSHCIAHGYDLSYGLAQQKAAVLSGHWPLMRYDPRLQEQGQNPFQLDSKRPSLAFKQYAYQEARYSMLARSDPEAARVLLDSAQQDIERRWRIYEDRAAMLDHDSATNPQRGGA
jgi:pyruvate-ferredoxin/flavodoxin oxidoreductase